MGESPVLTVFLTGSSASTTPVPNADAGPACERRDRLVITLFLPGLNSHPQALIAIACGLTVILIKAVGALEVLTK
jgi:hypothetical protein